MYFYVDESGQTGQNLFDNTQPYLYYGVLSSRTNLDVLAVNRLKSIRNKLGVDRLHAADLGNGKLIEIKSDLTALKKKFDLRFDFYRLTKADHALISFFDQVFDQGLNPAVPWTAYWTPMRYILLIKLAYLFDEDLLKMAWEARITLNNSCAENLLVSVCRELVKRVGVLTDARSRELIIDGLTWVINNPSEIGYNAKTKKDSLQISPNLIGFQTVMHGIAYRLKKNKAKASEVIVDRQSQFNAAQEFIADFYHKARHLPWANGPGLPVMDLKHMPTAPIKCTPGTDSVGLELVDIYIWVFKRYFEQKKLAPELYELILDQRHRGIYDEVSINALSERWGKWFQELPEPTAERAEIAKEFLRFQEERRKPFTVNQSNN